MEAQTIGDQGWDLVANWSEAPLEIVLTGPWEVQDGALTLPQVGAAKLEIPLALGNFELTMRYRVHDYGTYGAMTVTLREAHPWETYAVRFHEYGITTTRRHGYWNDFLTLSDVAPAPVRGAWHDLRITAHEDVIEVWVDGVLRKRVTDPDRRYSAGGLAVSLSNISLGIDSLAVRARVQPAALPPRATDLNVERILPESGRITGTFLSLDGSNLLRSPAAWTAEFDAMQAIGIDTLIVRNVVSEIGTIYTVAATLMEQAERTGIKVYLGIPGFGGYQWTGSASQEVEAQIERATKAMDLINEQYGDRSAFAGWYLENEVDEKDLVSPRYEVTERYYRRLTEYAHGITPDLPVIVAPSFDSGTSPNWVADKWRSLLASTGIDILALQDSVGAGRSVPELNPAYFAAMREAAADAGALLWADVEIFDIATWQPASLQLVERQLHAVADVVEKTVVFEFHRYMNPSRSLPARALYEGYVEMLK